MPKTKDAFALRDFDAERIWKQKFFCETKADDDDDFPINIFWDLPRIYDVDMYHELKALRERPFVTDEEILEAYCKQAIKSQKECEYARIQGIIEILKEISSEVAVYLERIRRHSKRLEEYSRKWNEEICSNETFSATEIRTRTRRIQSLIRLYTFFQSAIKRLQRAIKRCVTEIVEGYERTDRDIFAIRLRQARIEAGLTQTNLAEKLGITQGGYTNYENSRCEPSISMLKRLSRILNRSPNWLLDMTP